MLSILTKLFSAQKIEKLFQSVVSQLNKWAKLLEYPYICIRMFACIYISTFVSISATKFPEVLSRAIREVALTNYN